MKVCAATFLALALAGCDWGRFGTSQDEADARAHDAAIDATEGQFASLRSKIEELERKVQELEQRTGDTEAMLRAVRADQAQNIDVINDNARIANARYDEYRHHTH